MAVVRKNAVQRRAVIVGIWRDVVVRKSGSFSIAAMPIEINTLYQIRSHPISLNQDESV